MRIHKDDPGAFRYYVLLDGDRLDTCVEADDVEGWADCLILDEVDPDGRWRTYMTNESLEPLVERRHGKVEIRKE